MPDTDVISICLLDEHKQVINNRNYVVYTLPLQSLSSFNI